MKHIAGGIAVIALGTFGIAGILASSGSVRSWLDSKCHYTGTSRDQNGHRARRYDCPGSASTIAHRLRDAHHPADQRSTPAGHFLRFRNQMVGLTAGAVAGRSIARLASERDGYGFFNNYVGGWWGSYGGPAERFRGGGPGGGK